MNVLIPYVAPDNVLVSVKTDNLVCKTNCLTGYLSVLHFAQHPPPNNFMDHSSIKGFSKLSKLLWMRFYRLKWSWNTNYALGTLSWFFIWFSCDAYINPTHEGIQGELQWRQRSFHKCWERRLFHQTCRALGIRRFPKKNLHSKRHH